MSIMDEMTLEGKLKRQLDHPKIKEYTEEMIIDLLLYGHTNTSKYDIERLLKEIEEDE